MKREVWIEETEVDLASTEVMTIARAARYLGVYPQAVSLALDRGDLTVLIDRTAPKRQGRRVVLRSEVEEWKGRREQRLRPEVGEHSARPMYSW